ncbi:helix-turn-helix domain-containing protein [Nocardiopsis suaedae]|uniref:Helix-turn-helix transcriptional regulator n=1 Tax=Nocardiopsis suaedae TaxID=3018444 RepID=A0ABT4TSE7_9ACTN|nr:helix-turn-helix transcriptional regulator [Nocardiopsis suaedae]MDA2807602.1 helix-turn-helix transcriptional regulator [Nocardiopsis suaedae]
MVRTPLTEGQRDRGRALGQILRAARAPRTAAEVAHDAGISIDTLRKIERGAIPNPAFFTIAALARALGMDMNDLAAGLAAAEEAPQGQDRGLQAS